MTPIYNIVTKKNGDTWKGMQLTVTIDGSTDLSGVTFFCQFRHGAENGTVVKDLSIGSGITVVDEENGIIKIDKFDIDFDKIGLLYYDVKAVKDGDTVTVLKGEWLIEQNVTVID